jgi:hypothetical protein
MSEKEIKKVCKCENCGNEAEMMITCSLEDAAPAHSHHGTAEEKPRAKGHAVCSHCGNEADMWLDS